MLLASSYSYPLLGAFWTIFEIFLWVIWFWILITVFIDIFRSPDLSGWGKALWFIFVLIIPLIGVLVYLIARGGKMHEHGVQAAQQQDEAARAYIQQVAGSNSADELAKLADLRDRGVITPRSSSSRRPRSWPPEPSGGRPDGRRVRRHRPVLPRGRGSTGRSACPESGFGKPQEPGQAR